MTKQQYKPRKINSDELNSAIEGRKADSTKHNFFKIKNGKHFFHIFPAWKESESSLPHYAVQIHFLVDAEGKFKSYRCSKAAEGACVMCKVAQGQMASGNEDKKKAGQSLKAKKQYLYNAINVANGEQGIMCVGPQLHDAIQRELDRDVRFNQDPVSYANGLKLKITRTGSGLETEYEAMGEPERFSCKELESEYEHLPQLDVVYDTYTNEQLTRIMEGEADVTPTSSKNRDVKDTGKFTKPYLGSSLSKSDPSPVEVSDEDAEEVSNVLKDKKPAKKATLSLEEARKSLGMD